MTIGQVAKKSGRGVETIRFYQKEGLILEPQRPQNGFRQYPTEVVQEILFIRRAKELGFSLKDIAELMSLRDQKDACSNVKRMAATKLSAVRSRIDSLEKLAGVLQSFIQECDLTAEGCPILGSLEP